MNTATYAVRNSAPLLDLKGAARQVLPNLLGFPLSEAPVNVRAHAQFRWNLAALQAEQVRAELEVMGREFQLVQQPLLERGASLVTQRDEAQRQLHLPVSPVPEEQAELARLHSRLEQAEEALPLVEQASAQALADAGLTRREEVNLSEDEVASLGSELGAFAPYPASRLKGWISALPGILVGPALWELGLRTAWAQLGLDESLDAAGVAVACLLGVGIALTLKAVLEDRAASSARHDAARRGQISEAGRAAYLLRWQLAGHLVLVLLLVGFALIEANLVRQALEATDVAARQLAQPLWLAMLGALVALTPASLHGVNVGRRKGQDSAFAELRARSRVQALEAKRTRPEVRQAIVRVAALDSASAQVERARLKLGQSQAQVLARAQGEQAARTVHIGWIEAEMEAVTQRLQLHEADYGRRLEQASQRADQATAAALAGFEKLSSGTGKAPGFLARLKKAFRPGRQEVLA